MQHRQSALERRRRGNSQRCSAVLGAACTRIRKGIRKGISSILRTTTLQCILAYTPGSGAWTG